jgi:hypothetical protein
LLPFAPISSLFITCSTQVATSIQKGQRRLGWFFIPWRPHHCWLLFFFSFFFFECMTWLRSYYKITQQIITFYSFLNIVCHKSFARLIIWLRVWNNELGSIASTDIDWTDSS